MGDNHMENRTYPRRRLNRAVLASGLIVLGMLLMAINFVNLRSAPHDFSAIASDLGTSVGEAAGSIGGSIGEAAGSVGSSIGEAAGSLGESAGNLFGEVGRSIGDFFGGQPQAAPSLIGVLWPLLLIAVGVFLILRRPTAREKVKHDDL